MKKLQKIFFVISFSLLALLPWSDYLLAYPDTAVEGIIIVNEHVGMTSRDPRSIARDFIMYALSFLGIIAVIIVIYAGFQWMTSGGNQERVASAKKMLIAGLIGLVIILLSLALTRWVIFSVANEVIV